MLLHTGFNYMFADAHKKKIMLIEFLSQKIAVDLGSYTTMRNSPWFEETSAD